MDIDPTTTAAVEDYILTHIPLARAMQVTIPRYAGDELEMAAPLAPNSNDKGCAFGGSMVSLLTLAGWGLIELGLRAHAVRCDIYIGGSSVRYREPVWGELRGIARFAEADALSKLLAALRQRGKGHTDVTCEIAGTGRAAATLDARFVAKLHG